MKKYLKNLAFIFMLIGLFTNKSIATTSNGSFGFFDNIVDTTLWYVTLELDLDSLFTNKKKDNYYPAKFSFKGDDGEMVNWDIKVRARGRFRRMTCEFPPLKLKFPKKQMKAAGFGKHNDVKLVTHCTEDKKATENLFREYLTYQLYQKLTNVSFETRMIQITYRDTGTGTETITYGIFIEDAKGLAARMKSKVCKECYGTPIPEFDQENLRTQCLFQYMIGNTDWSIEMSRNLKILNPKTEGEKRLVAPYDFDFSGVVNAAYAIPNADYKQQKIRDRIYVGADWTAEEWEGTIRHFRDRREALITTVENFELLSSRAKKDVKKYLAGFYKKLDQGFIPKKVLRNID